MRRAVIFALLPWSLLGASARAEDKVACRRSFEAAQSLRDEGKLVSARAQLVICSDSCPAAFQKVCDGWLADLDKTLPSIVVRAVDEGGLDLVGASLWVDGVAAKIDGKSIPLDPGTHALSIEIAGRDRVTKQIVVAEGEKNRPIVIAVPAPKKTAPKPPAAPIVEPRAPIAAYLVTGAGVAALGGFAYFGLRGDADHRALVEGCSRTASCSREERDGVKRDWLIADVFLASSVVLIGVGTYLFLTHDPKPVAVGLAPGAVRLSVSF